MEQVDQAISLCSEMHDIKEAIYENKSKMEGIGEDYQIQVCDNIFRFKAGGVQAANSDNTLLFHVAQEKKKNTQGPVMKWSQCFELSS